jgi:hypothetical protein
MANFPKPPSSNGKKAGKRQNQKMIISADIYNYGTVYIGPRDVEEESQYTFIFGEDDYCISFRVTFNDDVVRHYDGASSSSASLDKPLGVNKTENKSTKPGAPAPTQGPNSVADALGTPVP